MPREIIAQVVFDEIAAQIAAIESQQALVAMTNFVAREQARRVLTEQIIARLDRLIDGADKGQKKKLRALKRQAGAVKGLLQQAHDQLFATVRRQIEHGDYPAAEFMQLLSEYEERHEPETWSDPPLYDRLDTFVDGLLQIEEMPRLQRQPEAEMVLYQPTPARIVLDLVRRLQLCRDDVFYDLGSGLGRVPIIVDLVSEAQVKGVEYEPAYVDYARRRARILNLPRATFINADAREVNYADGTIFYLYTPFKGKILQGVLDLLRYEARRRRIRVCTYGPGTLEVLGEEWLASSDGREPDIDRPMIYESR